MTTERSIALALPTSFEEIRGMANAFVQSGMFSDVKQLSQAIVKIQAGRELGLPPVYSMQNINMIRNRLTCSANTMAMLVKRSGNYDYRIKEHTDKVCTITFYQRELTVTGEKWVDVGISSFSIEDAKRADLLKPDSGWMKFPRAMLFSRAISQGARIYCPDAIGGVYTDEEIRSIPARPEDANTTVIDATTSEITEKKQDKEEPHIDPLVVELAGKVKEQLDGKPLETPSSTHEKQQPGSSGTIDLPSLEFKSIGEFYTACLKHFTISKTQVDKEISMYDLSKVDQRKKAWQQIIGVYNKKEDS